MTLEQSIYQSCVDCHKTTNDLSQPYLLISNKYTQQRNILLDIFSETPVYNHLNPQLNLENNIVVYWREGWIAMKWSARRVEIADGLMTAITEIRRNSAEFGAFAASPLWETWPDDQAVRARHNPTRLLQRNDSVCYLWTGFNGNMLAEVVKKFRLINLVQYLIDQPNQLDL